MSFLLNLDVAKTHLLSRKKQTLVASMGVTFGIGMFILIAGVMTGVNNLLDETMLANSPHIHIFNKIESKRPTLLERFGVGGEESIVYHQRPRAEKLELRNGLQIAKSIQDDPEALGVSPRVSTQVFYNFGPVPIGGYVQGVDIMEEDRLFSISNKMHEGDIDNLIRTRNSIIMGTGLAEKLNVHSGDRVTVTTPSGNQTVLKVVGTFATGLAAVDDANSYANLADVQQMLGKPASYVTDINIKLKDIKRASAKTAEYRSRFGMYAEDWETANAVFLTGFTIRNAMTYIVACTLLLVAGFGIYNIMNMTIVEKMKDIAILKATGFAGRDVVGIFILESVIIGLIGAVGGIILGYIASTALSRVPMDMKGFVAMDTFPVNRDIRFYFIGVVFALITTLLAGYFPSKKAGRIDPVAILRG